MTNGPSGRCLTNLREDILFGVYSILFDLFVWIKVCMRSVIGLDRNGGGLSERNLGSGTQNGIREVKWELVS